MSDDAKQPEPKETVQKGYQPVPLNRQSAALPFHLDHGYQPNKGTIDVSKPPRGGSGVSPKYDDPKSNSEKKG